MPAGANPPLVKHPGDDLRSGSTFWGNSIGLKAAMSISGLVLALFLVEHVVGNLLVYAGPATINGFTAALDSQWIVWLVWIVRVVLIDRRALGMAGQAKREGFGHCGTIGECEAVCPSGIRLEVIARMNKEFLRAAFRGKGEPGTLAAAPSPVATTRQG